MNKLLRFITETTVGSEKRREEEAAKKAPQNGVCEEFQKEVAEKAPQNEVLEEFKKEAERTRQAVLRRLGEMTTQQECIKVLCIVKNKLDEKNGAKVSIACKGYGKYTVDGEEVIINKDITIGVMVSVIDMVPAFKRGEPTTTIEPKVDIWFSTTTE